MCHYKRKGHFQWVLGWPAKLALPGDPAKPDKCPDDAFLLLNAEDVRVYDALGSITKFADNKSVPEERTNRKAYAENKAKMSDALIGGFKFGAFEKGACWLSDASAVLRWRAQEAKKKREAKKADGASSPSSSSSKGSGKRKAEASEDEEDAASEDEADSEEEEKPKKKVAKPEPVKKKAAESSEEEVDSDEPKKKKKVVESSSEEEPKKKTKTKSPAPAKPKYLNDAIDVPVTTAGQQTRVFSHIICRKCITNPVWAKGSSMIAPEVPKSGIVSDSYPIVTDASKMDVSARLALTVALGKPGSVPNDRNDVVKLYKRSNTIVPAATDDEVQMLAAENYRQMLETRVKAITAARSSLDEVPKKSKAEIEALQEKELEEGDDSESSVASEEEKPAEKDVETSNSDEEEAPPPPPPPAKVNLWDEVEKITGKRFEAIEKRFDKMEKASELRSGRIEAMLEKLMEERVSVKKEEKPSSTKRPAAAATVTLPTEKKIKAVPLPKVF